MKRSLLIFVLSATFAFGADLITNVDNRDTTSLNGSWRMIIDPYESGFYDYRYNESRWGYFRDAEPRDKSDLVEYSFDKAELISVPGDWNSQKEKLFLYEGTVWYRKTFDYSLEEGKRLFVYFGAANYETIAYLNDKKLGRHEGGFTPFCFEITDHVKPKDNSLVVKVDNKRVETAVPTVMSDWWNYGGLTRRVMLIEESETFIQDSFIQLEQGSRSQIAGWVQLEGSEKQQEIEFSIPEAGISKAFRTDENGRAEISLKADLQLWSPQNPKLYDVIIEAGGSRLENQIGFRSIETKGDEILLNGSPVYLRGICIHEEAPLREGRAFLKEDAEILLEWAKQLNCNFVRLAHYPHNEYMTRLADEMGIMVWSEIPLYWTISWENEKVYENALSQLDEMITRDKNKASVIMWSVANETPISRRRTEFLASLTEEARKLDSTRLITAALEKHTRGSSMHVDDPLGEYLDVLGCNEYEGWYSGDKGFSRTWETPYNKPLVMSEFGGGALQGYHADSETRWSEEFQASLYEKQFGMLNKIDFLRGTTPWILRDFRSPRRPLADIQDFYNRKGLISERGEKKKAFYLLQEWYEEKMQ
ncbi:glycoside hydrolase family 2 protein [Sedimentisphaera salicampi]|uniref:glycoside hydrolase family 2 protein n=1 Tax=Sedimentisphaera salicampi TaxID=1941349 RepID=UPI000B9B149A|nr:glycoside hydrolase family 2 TIM barrel-domain containing protein [Sedimentisphaera salicampi]OXU15366.1 Beta-glucuronidase [Sedimentisphaera salicampi]